MDRREFFARTGVGLASSVLPDIAGLLRIEKEPEPVTNLVPPGRACELFVSCLTDDFDIVTASSGLKSYELDGSKPSDLARKVLHRTGVGLVFADIVGRERRYRNCAVAMRFYEDFVKKYSVVIQSFGPSAHARHLMHPESAHKIWFALSTVTYDSCYMPDRLGQHLIARYMAKQYWSDRRIGATV